MIQPHSSNLFDKLVVAAGFFLLAIVDSNFALLTISIGCAAFLMVDVKEEDETMSKDHDTRIKELENELLKAKRIQDTMAHNFPDGLICIFNREMEYLYANGREIGELGISARNIRGKSIKVDFHPALNAYAATELKRAFDGEHVAYEVITNNNAYFISSTPIYDTSNEVNEILVIVRNITTRIKLENNLKRAHEKEKEFNILRSQFVTLASHEFRTPLSTILTSVFLLENYKGDDYEEEKKSYIDKIKRAVTSLTNLLNDFLSIGKIEEGKIKVTPSEIELKPFLEEIVQEMVSDKKVQQQILFTLESPSENIITDPQLLKHIVVNLLSNAIKFSPKEKDVQLLVELKKERLIIRVTDEGMGIPEDEKGQIFKRFFRGENVSNIDGTGLGLNIVKKYVRLLKGSIEFTSQIHRGSTFVVVIPTSKSIENPVS